MDLVAESIEQNWDFDSKLDFVCVNHDAWQDRFYLPEIKNRVEGSIPFVQDESINSLMKVWEKYEAAKDDIYVIDKEGKIAKFFALPESNLNNDNVKNAIKQVLKGSPC